MAPRPGPDVKAATYRLPEDAHRIVKEVVATEAAKGNRVTQDTVVLQALRHYAKAKNRPNIGPQPGAQHTYQVAAHREGTWWIVVVPELSAVSQAETLDEIEPTAKDLVSALTDADEAGIQLNVAVLGALSIATAKEVL